MWPFNKSKSSKKHTSKPRFSRLYTEAMKSRLLADFLSPSSSADREIRPALRTLRDRSGSWLKMKAENCNQAMSKLAQAFEAKH